MRRLYVYEHPEWPQLRWDSSRVADSLAAVRYGQGRVVGRMRALGFDLQQEAVLETLGDSRESGACIKERIDMVLRGKSSLCITTPLTIGPTR
ncbi:MAG: DUF4172 domain-containing protein [Actinomycetia bacterium]|nr:DUF4172 domain-containing protein [Actinomycetes bacterium]